MAENAFRLFSRIPHKFFGMAGQYYRIGGREGIMAEGEAKLDILENSVRQSGSKNHALLSIVCASRTR